MKNLITTLLLILCMASSNLIVAQSQNNPNGQTNQAYHTIYPKKGLAITGKISSVSKDSIFYYPHFDSNKMYALSLKEVETYTFNKSQEDSNEVNALTQFNLSEQNQIKHPVEIAGNSIKTAVTFGIIGSSLKVISPFLITTKEEKKTITISGVKTEYVVQKTDYTMFSVFMAAGIVCDFIGIISYYNAGDKLSEWGKSQNKISMNIAPNGFKISKRF